ncbi:MAG: hypothetical protein CM15mV5_0640 [uncultured marine virus]|nr:MAG: hypothetical protein CM15mV5_0640 [uncultured marine virus]
MLNMIINRILYIGALGGLLTMCGTAPITPPADAAEQQPVILELKLVIEQNTEKNMYQY